MARPTPAPDRRITLELKDGSRLVGELEELESFRVKTEYGELTIPSKAIAGIRLGGYAAGGDGHVSSILFGNGDQLSGRLLLDAVTLEAKWGQAKVSPTQMKSIIMTAQQMTWIHNGTWKLIPRDQAQPQSVPAYAPQPLAPAPYSAPSAAPATYPYGASYPSAAAPPLKTLSAVRRPVS